MPRLFVSSVLGVLSSPNVRPPGNVRNNWTLAALIPTWASTGQPPCPLAVMAFPGHSCMLMVATAVAVAVEVAVEKQAVAEIESVPMHKGLG